MKLSMDGSLHEVICPQYDTRYCYDECNWFGNCPDQERGEALTEKQAICTSCGAVWERHQMFRFTPSRRTQLLCPDCYRKASHSVHEHVTEKTGHKGEQ